MVKMLQFLDYETSNDAENESNPITGPYTNLSANQNIYYLLISATFTLNVDLLEHIQLELIRYQI